MSDTAAIQAHIASKTTTPIPKGVYKISDTLQLTQAYGYRLCGSGGQIRTEQQATHPKCVATVLKWNGPPDIPMLEISGNMGLVVSGLNFVAGNASQAILIRDGGGSLNLALRDIGIIGGKVGIQCGTSSGEQTCANITFDNLHCQLQTEACVRLMNLQSLEHLFLRPKFVQAPIGIDVQYGGDVSIVGGGSYEVESFLHLGNGGRNCRGFDVMSFRFDGKTTRTAWVTYDDPKKTKTFGPITFRNCAQNNGQQNSRFPLITAAPGSRIVCRECSFDGNYDNWGAVYSDRSAGGELIIENSDGLDGTNLESYVTRHGSRAFVEFRHCGTLYGPTGSYSTFPDRPESVPQFTADEADGLRELLGSRAAIAKAIHTAGRVDAGELRAAFPTE